MSGQYFYSFDHFVFNWVEENTVGKCSTRIDPEVIHRLSQLFITIFKNISVIVGSKWIPDCSDIYSITFSLLQADRYDLSWRRASQTSAKAKIRAAKGICSPFNRCG